MTKAEQTRLIAWRLKILRWAGEEPRQVARTCRHFGISRTAFYRWKQRFDLHGEAALADRPRTPLSSPRETPREVVSKILYLRQKYHFGPGRIAGYLRRFHQVAIAVSSVHRILGKHGAGESEVPTPPEALEALREAATRAPPAARREVPRAHSRDR